MNGAGTGIVRTFRLLLVLLVPPRAGAVCSGAALGMTAPAAARLLTVTTTARTTADVEIAETDVAKLKVGQKVDFTFSAYDGTVEGYLVSYPAIGEVTSRGATIVKATVRIDDVPIGILPNFSFTGKIQITEPEQKLVVERYAIRRMSVSKKGEKAKKTTKISSKAEWAGHHRFN